MKIQNSPKPDSCLITTLNALCDFNMRFVPIHGCEGLSWIPFLYRRTAAAACDEQLWGENSPSGWGFPKAAWRRSKITCLPVKLRYWCNHALPSQPSCCHWYLKNSELIKTLLEFVFTSIFTEVKSSLNSSVFHNTLGPVGPLCTDEIQNPHSIINYTYYSRFHLFLCSLSCAWAGTAVCASETLTCLTPVIELQVGYRGGHVTFSGSRLKSSWK